MATNFDNNAITSSGGFKPSSKDTPIDIRSRIETEADITDIPNPFVGLEIFVKDTQKKFRVLSLKEVTLGATKKTVIDVYEEIFNFSGDYEDLTNKPNIPTKISELENDENYLTNIPDEYITEEELENKGYLTEHQSLEGYAKTEDVNDALELKANKTEIPNIEGLATETYVTNAIANAQLGGGDTEVDLSGYATKDDVSDVQNDWLGGKKLKYLTQAEYDLLTEDEKNDDSIVYNITDAENTVHEHDNMEVLDTITQDKIDKWNNHFSGDYNDLTNKPNIPSLDGYATEVYVTNAIANAQLGGEDAEINLSGYATKDDISNIQNDYLGGKKLKYLTQSEYELLSDDEKNDNSIVYNIIDANEPIIPQDVKINNNLLQLIDGNGNTIGNGVIINNNQGGTYSLPIATSNSLGGVKIGNGLNIEADGTLNVEADNITTITDEEIDETLKNVFGESFIPTETIVCTGISLDKTELNLTTGDFIKLNATVTPSDCTDEIVWTTSNGNCTVVDGLVTGVTEGNCIITARCGNYSATCNVVVEISETTEPEESTYINYIYNSDTFTNPTSSDHPNKATYYVAYNCNKVATDGVWTLTKTVEAGTNAYGLIKQNTADKKIYYVRALVKSSSANVKVGLQGNTTVIPNVGEFCLMSYIYTDEYATSRNYQIDMIDASIGTVVEIKKPMMICLTDIYGSGNEPTNATECDIIFAEYVSGLIG